MIARLCAAAFVGLTTVSSIADSRAIELTDQRGRAIALAKPAERVVLIPIPPPSTFMAIDGSSRRVVGMNPASLPAIRDGILDRIFPAAARISTAVVRGAGFDPNVETILSLRPDVVFQWANQGDTIIAPLDRVGLKVVGINYGTQELQEGLMEIIGTTVGKPDRAAAIVDRHRAVRARIEQLTADIPTDRRPRVLYFLRFASSLIPSGRNTYNDFYVALAGGRNAAAAITGNAATVTFEQILEWNPEVILLGNFDAALPRDVYADSRWRTIKAVQDSRVYKVPLGGYRWDPPSQESPLMWMWLAALLHPERAAFDLRAEMRRDFRFLYDHALTDADIDAILFAADNAGAAGYARLTAR